MFGLRWILYSIAIAFSLASGYLVNFKHDRSARPMHLAIAAVVVWGLIFFIENHH